MDVRKYGFENLRRIMVLEEGFWGVTKKEGIDFLKIKFYEKKVNVQSVKAIR
uniref:Uncharacterized protein n=1 Tax=Medicago truncatula TaxID=3880 RepID=A2Q4S8_MEDTR|nr:hypothetical protein MtrDRAFT_AC157890g31v2 [Medicago truncatula]